MNTTLSFRPGNVAFPAEKKRSLRTGNDRLLKWRAWKGRFHPL